MKGILTIILNLFILMAAQAQPFKFVFNLPQPFHMNSETTLTLIVEQEFMGIRYNTKMDIKSLMDLKHSGSDENADLVFVANYRKLEIRVSSVLINMEVNTESNQKGDSLSQILKKLVGKEFKIHFNRKGVATQIDGLDQIIENTIMSSSLDESQKTEFIRNLIQSIGEEATLDNYRNNAAFYPDFAVKPRDIWEIKLDFIKTGIPMELNTNVRLKEITKNQADFISEGKINSQIKTGGYDTPTYRLAGTEVAEKIMDIKTGLILESIVSQSISGSIATYENNDPQKELLMPFKIISRCTILNSVLKN